MGKEFMRIAIVQFPGSNCERETMLAVKRAGMQPEEFLWNGSHEKLKDYAGYIIVGGFSYEDRSRAGVIAALDPIMQVIKSQSHIGKPILGICNGAQILVETGLVPGVENDALGMVLTDNKRVQNGKVLGTGFYNAWVNMRLSDHYQLNAFTRHLKPRDILSVPVAHAEGRFVIPPALLAEMQLLGANVFQYCDATGKIDDAFPVNPNGSIDNIAAVSNKAGNVMAMMPHPERTPNGDPIFRSMRDYIEEGYGPRVAPLNYYPRSQEMTGYRLPKDHHQVVIELMITDNQAITVENALNQLDLPVKIKRRIHWEIACDSLDVMEHIKASGVLFNDRKEKVVSETGVRQKKAMTFLIRPKDDMVGLQMQQMLENHFNVKGIRAIRHGILWEIAGDNNLINPIINSNILFNPYAHDYYYY
jgi:phosphoribosylformylglycinamidine synthase